MKPHSGGGMCCMCWNREHSTIIERDPPKVSSPCEMCCADVTWLCQGLCSRCYNRYVRPKIICRECNEVKIHAAHELCRTCYSRKRGR
jgi:hypothetical protein